MKTKGIKKQEMLTFPFRNTGIPIQFPLGTIYGAKDGPTLAVIGGMHGSEFCGIQAAIDLYNRIDPMKLRGTLIITTIYNMPAFLDHEAFIVPVDGKGPTRAFPGNLGGSYSEVMAYYFWENVLQGVDCCLELHGGDIPEALEPFVFCPITGNKEVDSMSRKISEAYNCGVIIEGEARMETKSGEAFEYLALTGVPAILTESGQQGILKQEDAEVHYIGITNVMKLLGMIDGEIVNTVERITLSYSGAIKTQTMGMWYPCVTLREIVKKGQLLGEIRDYFGKTLEDIVAPVDGMVMVVRTSPSVALGKALIEMHPLMEG